MDAPYQLDDTSQIITPALVVFQDVLEANLDQMIHVAGNASRLRPHCKTHKMPAVVRLQLERGITKHKCATFGEAEMLGQVGARDVFLAYNLVGPNVQRATEFQRKYPEVRFAVTADHQRPLGELAAAMRTAGQTINVLVDLDSGMHRTGLTIGPQAFELYRQISETPGLQADGLHLYDGQNHQTPLDERTRAVQAAWEPATALRDELESSGLEVPRIVAGGTGSFPIYAQLADPVLELSPGTCVFHDVGYGARFPDLDFTPAALLLTRVISRPVDDRITLDLGYKACASDPPADQRLVFPDLPDADVVLQNEEHLVLCTKQSQRFEPGDELWAIPRHICPTSALHKQAYVVKQGRLIEPWPVVARDRWLSV